MLRRCACLALLAVPWCAAAGAREIFVAPDGSDASGDGAIDSPYRTLVHAVDLAASGDTITLRGGSYAGGVTVEASGVTVRSHPGEWAVVSAPTWDSSVWSCIWLYAPGCALINLEIRGGYDYCIKFEYGNGLVEGCRVRGSGRDCIKIVPGADDVTVRSCEVYDSGLRDGSNAEGIDNVNADRMLVQDCFIHDIATNGAYAKGGAIGCVFERCLVMNCGASGLMLGQGTSEAFMDPVQNPGYYENIDGVVRNCIVVSTNAAGIAAQAALRPKFYNNTCVDVAASSFAGVYVAGTWHDSRQIRSEDAAFVNNVVVLPASSTRPVVFLTPQSVAGALYMNHNRYYHAGGAGEYWDENYWTGYHAFAEWKANLGVDGESAEGDPGLDAEMHLSSSSPCVDAGETVATVTDDYDGGPRTGQYDIGADEYGSGEKLQVPPPAGTVGTGGAGSAPVEPDGGPGGRCAAGTRPGGGWAAVLAAFLLAAALRRRRAGPAELPGSLAVGPGSAEEARLLGRNA